MTAQYSDLEGKTILVTGASSGIGRAIAIALGQQGAKVILNGRDSVRLEETAGLIDTDTTIKPADLTIEQERDKLVDQIPMLDGICHAAGIINPFPIRHLDQKQFDKVFNINAVAPILLTSRILGKKRLNPNSSLVFLSSVSSDRAMKGGSMYVISKSAIEAFSRAITLEHAGKGIRSNCLRPGLVETGIYIQAEQLATAAGSEERLKEYKDRYLLGMGTTQDIAQAALFLLSSASRWITGTGITMDGGLSPQI